METKRPKKAFVLRLDPAMYEALAEDARVQCRSINRHIEFLLKQELAARRTSGVAQ